MIENIGYLCRQELSELPYWETINNFLECQKKGWSFLLRFKEGSIPTVHQEYMTLKEIEKNRKEKGETWYDYVNGIAYGGYLLKCGIWG